MNKTRVELAKKNVHDDDSFSIKCEISFVMYYNPYFIYLGNWNFKMRTDNDELLCIKISNAKIEKL